MTESEHVNFFEDGNFKDEHYKEVHREYKFSSRHKEHWEAIFERDSDGKFFSVPFCHSVKDEMGWRECNEGNQQVLQVWPKLVTTTIYSDKQ